jgi:glycosyltransferase involved in cell wall biosynthesis
MKRIGILVVAYNASSTLAKVLDRIPREFVPKIEHVLICDNASEDSTYLVGLGYKQVFGDLPITVIRQPRNLGYGGNQKTGYQWALDQDLDIVVLLHADGQYAPEFLPQIVAPLERGECDAVFGSRMMEPGGALRGGMPLYKYVGNHVLTAIENGLVGMNLSEWHSGYRAYDVATLREIPFLDLSNEYDFDTGIILQLHEAGKRVVELPIPTYYGDEISYVNGMRYAKDIVMDVLRYRAHKLGLGTGATAFATPIDELKNGSASTQGDILAWLQHRPSSRVLDLACGDGALGARLRAFGHQVVGVDAVEHDGVVERLDKFVRADLDAGIPAEVGEGFDIVIARGAFERVREPDALFREIRGRVQPHGTAIVTVSNFGHWYPRVRVVAGRFDYDRSGILDRSHLRFFTRHSFERLAEDAGFAVRRRDATGVPFERPGANDAVPARGKGARALRVLDRLGADTWPSMFGFELVYELEPATRA